MNPIRLLLSETASRYLSETGEAAFAVVHRAMRPEEPGTSGRWVITLLPCTNIQADAAVRVARGLPRAVKISQRKQTVAQRFKGCPLPTRPSD